MTSLLAASFTVIIQTLTHATTVSATTWIIITNTQQEKLPRWTTIWPQQTSTEKWRGELLRSFPWGSCVPIYRGVARCKNVGWTTMASAECDPITGMWVWGRAPSGVQGQQQNPWSGCQGAKPPEAKRFCHWNMHPDKRQKSPLPNPVGPIVQNIK